MEVYELFRSVHAAKIALLVLNVAIVWYLIVTLRRQLEPPGFMGLNYGRGTPLTTLLGQILYGATLGGFLQLQHAHGF